MKKLAMALLSLFLLLPAAEAQSRKKRTAPKNSSRTSKYDINYPGFVGSNDQTNQEAARRLAQIRKYDSSYSFVSRRPYGSDSRPINEGTEGVLGEDQIRLNEKGEYRNLNSNTGVPLPANTGGSGR